MSWIRRSADRPPIVQPEASGGPGQMLSHEIIRSDEELLGKGRLYKEIVLEKDCGVGYHVHEGDFEIYLIQSGEAEYNDNGSITTLHPGDVTFTGPGEGHAITNKNEEPLLLVALILYA